MRFFQSRFAQLALWMGGAWLIFCLPWWLPPTQRMVSDSYVVGFNNGVAFLGLIVTLCLLFFSRLAASASRQANWGDKVDDLLRPAVIRRSEYALPLLFAGLHCALMWALYRTIPFTNYGEMGYTVSRSELLLLGRVPYQDFEWNYGPLFLLFPTTLVRLSGYSLSADESYMVMLVVLTTLSFAAIYFVLAQFNLSRGQRFFFFVLLGANFNIGLGANGSPTRFIAPYVALFAIYRLSCRTSQPDQRQSLALFGLMALSVATCFLVSPETGIVFGAGLLCFGAIQRKSARPRLRSPSLWLAPLALALGVAPFLAFSSAYLRSMASFGGGAANFPLVPSGHNLFFLGSLCFMVPLLGAYGWRTEKPSGALACGLGVMLTLFAAAALGRCDIPHIFYNGLGLFIVTLAFFGRYGSRFHFYPALFILLFLVAFPISYLFYYSATLSDVAAQRAQGARRVDRHFINRSLPESGAVRQIWSALPPGPIGLPLGAGEDLEIALKRRGRTAFEYYPYPSMEARTRPQLDRKLRDVSQMACIVVPRNRLVETPLDAASYARNQERFLTQLLLYPVAYRVQHWPLFPETEIRACIRSHFRPLKVVGDDVILVNRKPVPVVRN